MIVHNYFSYKALDLLALPRPPLVVFLLQHNHGHPSLSSVGVRFSMTRGNVKSWLAWNWAVSWQSCLIIFGSEEERHEKEWTISELILTNAVLISFINLASCFRVLAKSLLQFQSATSFFPVEQHMYYLLNRMARKTMIVMAGFCQSQLLFYNKSMIQAC